ncbi:MAG: 50S ribosomal protein L11 methyltransferase [Rhodospirillales bacterium]
MAILPPPQATFLWRVMISVPEDTVGAFEEMLEPHCMAISSFKDIGEWRVEGFTGAEPDEKAFLGRITRTAEKACCAPPDASFQLVAPRDWVAENFADFPPLSLGRYFIHGSHFEGTPPTGKIPIKLDAGAAFGSGEHASTAACLMMLDGLSKKRTFFKPLDMGSGSGILTLAMAKTWRARIIAVDIDDEATAVTHANAKKNHLGPLVRAFSGPGYRTPGVTRNGPYDLIVSNILARPLIRMAGDLAENLSPGGTAILSGLFERDGRRVIQAHRQHGLSLIRTMIINDWITIMMRR